MARRMCDVDRLRTFFDERFDISQFECPNDAVDVVLYYAERMSEEIPDEHEIEGGE